MIYKERIKELKDRIGISQKELANIIGISNTRYCHYENESEIIPLKYLNTLCNHFNVSFDYIFSFTDIKTYEIYINDIDGIKSGQRLKEFRKENKITQVKLAEILNTVQPVIAKYEKGINIIATPFLYTICKKYNISADYLLGKTDTPKYLR